MADTPDVPPRTATDRPALLDAGPTRVVHQHGARLDCDAAGCDPHHTNHGRVLQILGNEEVLPGGHIDGHAVTPMHRILVVGEWHETDPDRVLPHIATVEQHVFDQLLRYVLAHSYTDPAIDLWLDHHDDLDPPQLAEAALATLGHHAT